MQRIDFKKVRRVQMTTPIEKKNFGMPNYETLIERINSEDFPGQNLSEKTKRAYTEKILTIQKKLSKEFGVEMTPDTLLTYFKTQVENKSINQATARMYKSAIFFWLADTGKHKLGNGENIKEYEDVYFAIKSIKTNMLPTDSKNTSGKKRKGISKKELMQLEEYIKNKYYKNKHAIDLLLFIKANIILGLRPVEWKNICFFSYIETNEIGEYKIIKNKLKTRLAVSIENAKQSHKRANGQYRWLLLDKINEEQLATILNFKNRIDTFIEKNGEDSIDAFFQPLQKLMHRIFKASSTAYDKLPTLYSSRHQAIADAKKAGLQEVEIAAMFGHASIHTAKIHYGRKYDGWQKPICSPTKESIWNVRKTINPENLTITRQNLDKARELLKTN